MARRVKLNELGDLFDDRSFPADRATLVEEYDDVTLQYADGEESLSSVLERTGDDTYDSADDLTSEVMNVVPVEAVGEPGQSEGEG